MEAVPIPASLVKIPLDRPTLRQENREPTAPPVTARGEKAPFTMEERARGRARRFPEMTSRHRRMYPTAAKGTSFSVVFPMRRTPPSSTAPMHRAMTSPKTRSPKRVSRPPRDRRIW